MKANHHSIIFFRRILLTIIAICMITGSMTGCMLLPLVYIMHQEEVDSERPDEALLEVMPGAEGFELIEFDPAKYPATVTEIYKETSGQGYVIKLNTTGHNPDLIIMCGVDPNGVVIGATCLSSNETFGHEKTFGSNLVGKDEAGVDAVDTVAGSTKTTAAYKNAIMDAFAAVRILEGGAVNEG